jgi:hypothetical protein
MSSLPPGESKSKLNESSLRMQLALVRLHVEFLELGLDIDRRHVKIGLSVLIALAIFVITVMSRQGAVRVRTLQRKPLSQVAVAHCRYLHARLAVIP